MKTKRLNKLPKDISEISNGGIYRQSVRCGKTSCKCAAGETHPAYYFFTRLGGKLRKFYIPKAQLESFRLLVNAAAEQRSERRHSVLCSNRSLSEMRLKLREVAAPQT